MSAPFSRAGRIRPFTEEQFRDDEFPQVDTSVVLIGDILVTEPDQDELITEDGYNFAVTT